MSSPLSVRQRKRLFQPVVGQEADRIVGDHLDRIRHDALVQAPHAFRAQNRRERVADASVVTSGEL